MTSGGGELPVDPPATPVPAAGDAADTRPGERTFAELDALLGRAASEVQRGLEEGVARIGRYTLVTTVGEGGFGTVWMASQEEPVRRLVALKLFRRDPGSRAVLQRFQNERQTLARMDHPNVATVLDAGITDDGRPWFVMPFIDGLPINALCDERRLAIRERVRLFAEVCDGVQHAHQKGIIHRDIKPGNILVARGTDRLTPKVIDFGVAKALEPSDMQSQRTADGQRLGTPQYMPPEQWMHGASIADARSDVYALGVVLAELLVGGPPTRLPRSPLEVPEAVPPTAWLAAAIARDPAAAARTASDRGTTVDALAESVRGDLDAIVRRATAPHPDDRYATAAALADDVRRWLAGHAVAARLLGPWERAVRVARRHRSASILAAVAFLAVLTAAAIWWTDAASARRSREAALVAERQSTRTFDITRTMIDEVIAQQRNSRDSSVARATFVRVEKMVDRIAEDDPLTAGRLATLVVRGHLEAWEHRNAYALLERSFKRVLAVDPEGESIAFRELLPEMVRMGAKFDRPMAAMLGPMAFRVIAEDGTLRSEDTRLLTTSLENGRIPWPFFSSVNDPELALASAQWFAGLYEDPVEAGCVLALGRIFSLIARDSDPRQFPEMRSALEYLRQHMPPDDPRLLMAEAQIGVILSIRGYSNEDVVGWLAVNCARLEHALGRGSPRAVNAYWNLAYCCVHIGLVQDAYDMYIRQLWPEYRRQDPRDGLRPWYLAYFAPIAFLVCDYETAYATSLTQLADEVAAGGSARGGVSALSARVLAGVLAQWGDEQGAAEVERDFGVVRMRPSDTGW